MWSYKGAGFADQSRRYHTAVSLWGSFSPEANPLAFIFFLQTNTISTSFSTLLPPSEVWGRSSDQRRASFFFSNLSVAKISILGEARGKRDCHLSSRRLQQPFPSGRPEGPVPSVSSWGLMGPGAAGTRRSSNVSCEGGDRSPSTVGERRSGPPYDTPDSAGWTPVEPKETQHLECFSFLRENLYKIKKHRKKALRFLKKCWLNI